MISRQKHGLKIPRTVSSDIACQMGHDPYKDFENTVIASPPRRKAIPHNLRARSQRSGFSTSPLIRACGIHLTTF